MSERCFDLDRYLPLKAYRQQIEQVSAALKASRVRENGFIKMNVNVSAYVPYKQRMTSKTNFKKIDFHRFPFRSSFNRICSECDFC